MLRNAIPTASRAPAPSIATYGVAADPATLPQALAFFQRHPIRIEGSAADQASFDAGLRQTLVGAGIKTLMARDPQGTLRQLQGGTGEAGNTGANGEADPAVALHPAIAALTPEERTRAIPQARAAVYVAQGKAQADVAQRTTAATQPGANPATPPTLPEFIGAYGMERGTQLHSEMTDKLSQNQYQKNFAALPSAEVERARNDAQAGLHATARANADTLGTPAPADARTDANDSAFALRTQADVADPHSAAQSRDATNRQSAAAAILTARAQDPVQAGIDAGAFGLKPADMSTPQAVLASAATRGPVVGVIADTYNIGRVAFSNSEFADLGKTAAAMPPQARGPFFQQLADTLKDPELVRATFKRLGADSPVLAEAARMQYEEQASQPGPANGASGIISAPEHIYKGYTALNPTDGSPPQAMPPDMETRAAFTPVESDAQAPGVAETRYQTARAIYASLAQGDKDTSGTFDPARWTVSQRMATDGSGTAREVGLDRVDPPNLPNVTDNHLGPKEGNLGKTPDPQSTREPKSFLESVQTAMNGEEVRYDGPQDVKDFNALKVYKVGRAWSDPVHETMSDIAIRKVFPDLSESEYKQYLKGVVWNDFPSKGNSSTPQTTFGLGLDILGHDVFGMDTPGYQSHYGSKQYWHSMAPEGKWSNTQVRDMIIDQAREWYNDALKQGPSFYAFGQLGKVSHILQDAYSGSHVDRDEDWRVRGFQSFGSQDETAHGNADKIGDYGSWDKIPGAPGAFGATVNLLTLFKNKAPFDGPNGVAEFLRNWVYKFSPGAEERPAGGTRPEFGKTPPAILYPKIRRDKP